MNIEVCCSDAAEHRRRVEQRENPIATLTLPTWQEVVTREYETWEGDVVRIDTAGETPDDSWNALLRMMSERG